MRSLQPWPPSYNPVAGKFCIRTGLFSCVPQFAASYSYTPAWPSGLLSNVLILAIFVYMSVGEMLVWTSTRLHSLWEQLNVLAACYYLHSEDVSHLPFKSFVPLLIGVFFLLFFFWDFYFMCMRVLTTCMLNVPHDCGTQERQKRVSYLLKLEL